MHSTGTKLTAGALTLLALLAGGPAPVAAHSWIERALKIEPVSRQFFGAEGFPRGYIPRTDPSFNDEEYILRLPYTGTAFYTGDETINKHPIDPNPSYDLLEAAPGDFIAILHYENGHTTKPESNPDKPLNRGTIYIYGTDQPRDEEKLFDVHLRWNKDGTGGDKRGRLLATRNYDDGQCYEARGEGLALERATALGVDPMTPLACQSDLQLPEDLKPDSNYTIYWYWDWPNLNRDAIDFEATKDGLFPWAGTFMRGEQDPNGFTMAAIATNESYASTLDIRVVSKDSEVRSKAQIGANVNSAGSSSGGDQGTVFNMAIQAQLKNNFGVPVDEGSSGDQPQQPPAETPTPSTDVPAPAPTTETAPTADGPAATVTVTVTQPPVTVPTTVYVTQLPESTPVSETTSSPSSETSKKPCSTSGGEPVHVVTEVETQYTTVYPEGTPTTSPTTVLTTTTTSTPSPIITPEAVTTALIFETRRIPPPSTPRWPNQTEQWSSQEPERVKRTNWWFGRG